MKSSALVANPAGVVAVETKWYFFFHFLRHGFRQVTFNKEDRKDILVSRIVA